MDTDCFASDSKNTPSWVVRRDSRWRTMVSRVQTADSRSSCAMTNVDFSIIDVTRLTRGSHHTVTLAPGALHDHPQRYIYHKLGRITTDVEAPLTSLHLSRATPRCCCRRRVESVAVGNDDLIDYAVFVFVYVDHCPIIHWIILQLLLRVGIYLRSLRCVPNSVY